MTPKLTETIYVDFITSSPTTGAAIDADSLPTCEVFEDATDTAILSPTVVKRTSKTGNYRVPIACTAANGFEASKSYNAVVSATVGAVAAKAVIRTFQVRTYSVDDMGSQGNGGTLRFDDIWKWTTAGSVSSGQIRGSVADWNTITELWVHNVTNGTTNLSAYLKVVAANDTIRVQQENTPSVWNSYLVTGAAVDMTTWVKIPVSIRASAGVSAPATATNCLVSFFRPNNLDWTDTERSQIRHRIGIDGTAAAPTATPSLALQTTSTSIKTVTDKVDTALVVDGAVYQYTANALELGPAGGGGGGDASQATLLAVKAKTDALPSDPADASDIAASFTTVNTKLDTITSGLPLDATELNAIADALLKRDWTAVTGEASYSVLQALRMLRNSWNTTGGTLSVKKEDGATNAWTRALATDAAADPIIGAT